MAGLAEFGRACTRGAVEGLRDMIQLFFPDPCAGCGQPLPRAGIPVCPQCLHRLPRTGFESMAVNPVEKLFRGRIPLQSACSLFYFSRGSAIQSMIHALKYHQAPELGHFLGRQMGEALRASGNYGNTRAIVPLPLNRRKQQVRGYNQAERIASGMGEIMELPVLTDAVEKERVGQSQTRKNRTDRWQHMSGTFLARPEILAKYPELILVDDVVTTGATLEACGKALLDAGLAQLHLVTLAFADR